MPTRSTFKKSIDQAQHYRLLDGKMSLMGNIFVYRLHSSSDTAQPGTGLGTATVSEAIIKATAMARDSKASCMFV